MRKESKIENSVQLAQIAGYHRGTNDQYKIFASDRPQKATHDYKLPDGTLPKMYGIELENQVWGVSNDTVYANLWKHVILPLFPADLWKIERDGSLGHNGGTAAECITQPMTRAFIRNHYKDFKTMFDEMFPAFGIAADKTGDCGMHVHISLTCFGSTKATQDEAIRKLYYIVNWHYGLMTALLYRRPDRTEYCRCMDYSIARTMDLRSMPASHGNCFNGSHYDENNIELRLPGGQKNFACFRNTMESVFHLVDIVKTISWKDCDDITKVFAGCNQYVYDRLYSYVKRAGFITESQLAAIRDTVKNAELL